MMFDFSALDHESFMREALKEADRALQEGERPIGAVVVHDGKVVGRGRALHEARHSEIAHAEMNALLDVEQYIHDHIHDGCALYTTVEPCVMCLGAVVMSDILEVHHVLRHRHHRNDHQQRPARQPARRSVCAPRADLLAAGLRKQQ